MYYYIKLLLISKSTFSSLFSLSPHLSGPLYRPSYSYSFLLPLSITIPNRIFIYFTWPHIFANNRNHFFFGLLLRRFSISFISFVFFTTPSLFLLSICLNYLDRFFLIFPVIFISSIYYT